MTQRWCWIPMVGMWGLGLVGCAPEPAPRVQDAASPSASPSAPTPLSPAATVPSATLRLDFAAGRATRYRLRREYRKEVTWQGAGTEGADPRRGGVSTTRLDLTYRQRVLRVDPNGAADLAITLEALAYRVTVTGRTQFDFDSRREADAQAPLMALVGQGYEITLSPSGRVVDLDTGTLAAAAAAVSEETPAGAIARRLLSAEAVHDRHTVTALAANPEPVRRVGDTWRVAAVEDFQQMGRRALYKVFTLAAVQPQVVIEFRGEPSAALATREDGAGDTPLASMMDQEEVYTGSLTLDPATGQVEGLHEALHVTWRVALTAADPNGGAAPVLSVMTARRSRDLRRLSEGGA